MDSLIGHDIENIPRTADVWTDNNTTFKDMHFSGPILQGLEENGFVKPSPIQLKALPLTRCGFDLIVQSKSGTGKTLVFVLSTLEIIDVTSPRVQCIVLTPTREIAMQVAEVFKAVGSKIKDLHVKTFIGGLPLSQDIVEVQNCHVAVGAPGRIRQLIELGHLKTEAVRLFILDEADQLMNPSIQPDINYIYWKQADTKQVLALSATYPPELVKFLSQYLRTGRHITPSSDPLPILRGISQFVSITRRHPDSTARLADKEKRLAQLLSSTKFNQAIVFTNYQSRAESTCNVLRGEGWSASWISSSQKQESRIKTMEDFRSGRSRVLVSTDLTSRGIDSKAVDLVINMDSPWDPRVYLHRMGRAGRFGSHGIVITILSDGDVFHFRKMYGQIGGDSLYVCVIPPEGVEDLRTVDKLKLKHIYGLAPESLELNPETGEASVARSSDKSFKETNGQCRGKESSKVNSKSQHDFDGVHNEPCDFPSLVTHDSKYKEPADADDNKENKSLNPVRKKSYSDMVQGEKNLEDPGKIQQIEKRKRMYCDVLRSKNDPGYHFDETIKETHFTGQKTKDEGGKPVEMNCQDLNAFFMRPNLNNDPVSFSDISSSKEKFLSVKPSKTDTLNDDPVAEEIDTHESCDIFEFKAKPTDGKLMTCPSVEESKAAKLLIETDEKSPKKKSGLKKKERKHSDNRDISKEIDTADISNHLSESVDKEKQSKAVGHSEHDSHHARKEKRTTKKVDKIRKSNLMTDETDKVDFTSSQRSQLIEQFFSRHSLIPKPTFETSKTSSRKRMDSVDLVQFYKDYLSENAPFAGDLKRVIKLFECPEGKKNEVKDVEVLPKPEKVDQAVAGPSKPLCREDFLKHHVLTKKASTKRSPRFDTYLSDSSTTEGEYILSQSYLNKLHHRSHRQSKPEIDPYQDWCTMFNHQMNTITKYIQYCDDFKFFP